MTTVRLSQAQTGIWFAQQRDPDSTAFHCAEYVRIPGPLADGEIGTLRDAVRGAVAETGTLTARFSADSNGVPQQELGSPWRDPVRVVDLRGAPDAQAAETAAADTMRAETAAPAALDSGALVTAVIFRLRGGGRTDGGADGDTLLYLRAHHLVLDGFGFSAVIRRVAALFTAACAATTAPPTPFAPLSGLLAEEDAYRASEQFALDRAFWRARTAHQGDAASLTDTARSAARAPLHRRGLLPAESARGLESAARAAGVAWPELVFAAAAVYTSAYTGSAAVVLGVPVLARPPAATKVATTSVNVLPLPLTVEPADDAATLAAQVHRLLADIRPHQRYRHEDLLRDLGLVGGARRLTGPQVNIKPFGYPLHFAGRRASVHYLEAGPVEDIELTVHTAAPGGALGFDIAANPDLYSAEEAEAHRLRLVELVGRLAAGDAAGTPVRRLPAATAAELSLIAECNDTAHNTTTTTLTAGIEWTVRRMPDAPAVRFDGTTITFRELGARADRLAWSLRARGADGRIVGVALPRSIDLVVALVAILKAGAAYLPLDPDNPDARLAYMIDDAAPACIITGSATAPRLPSDYTVQRVLVLDAPETREELAATPSEPPPRTDDPSAPAYVIYTSGSTGKPKGVVVGHAAISNRLDWMQGAFELGADDRVLQKTPCGFDVSVWEFFWPLLTGALMVVAEPGGHRDPGYLARVLEEESITTVHFVPSMLASFLDGLDDGLDAPGTPAPTGLRRVICSGEALGADVADRAVAVLDADVYNLYGPTEAAVDVSWWHHRRGEATMPIGHPVWNTRLHVLDAGLRALPPGATGELYLAGVQLADGYLGRPELTSKRFLTEIGADAAGEARMYRTGDLARRRTDGAVEYLGRTDDQVKIRGVRIEPDEVAAAVRAQDGVRQAAVIAVEGPHGPELAAYAVPDPAADVEPAALRSALAAELPAAMVPAHIMTIGRLPVTSNGKLDRPSLPAPRSDGTGRRSGESTPRTPLEEDLCAAFGAALDLPGGGVGVERVGAEDDFFALGGHSLAAAALARRLDPVLGREVPVGALFAAPTPRALAAALSGPDARDRSLDTLFHLRRTGAGRPLYCVHPAGGIGWGYAGLARSAAGDRPVIAVQARGLDGSVPLPARIDEMAQEYIDRIRATGDDGPYHLLGWSVGGVIAHAMAVQLQRLGAEVASLTMLDAYPADQWRDLAEPGEHEALRALLFMAGHDPDPDLLPDANPRGPSVALNPSVPLDRGETIRILRGAGSALGTLAPTTLSAVVDIVANNARLMREHVHGRYDGDLLVAVAAAPRDEDWLDPDAWLPHITGNLRRIDVDCTHPQIIGDAALARIGPVLAATLGEAEGLRQHGEPADARR